MHKYFRRIMNILLVAIFLLGMFSTVHAAIDPTSVVGGRTIC